MWAICRRAWESSWELLCSPCSRHSEHPTAKWKCELLRACIGARLQTTQRDTWKLQHHLCCYPVHFSMTWLLGVLDFTSGAESAVALNVTTLLMTHAAIPAFYICFAQVQMPTVRYQTTKNENQKDSLYYSCFLKTELRRPVSMPFTQKEDTAIVMLNCRLQDWYLLAWTGEAHLCSWVFVLYKEDFIIS